MATIIQGEQYAVEFVLTNGEVDITPDNSDDVKIKIGNIEKAYSDGSLSYDSVAECWLFPITQEQTLEWSSLSVPVQAQYKTGSVVISTEKQTIKVSPSIIRSVF